MLDALLVFQVPHEDVAIAAASGERAGPARMYGDGIDAVDHLLPWSRLLSMTLEGVPQLRIVLKVFHCHPPLNARADVALGKAFDGARLVL